MMLDPNQILHQNDLETNDDQHKSYPSTLFSGAQGTEPSINYWPQMSIRYRYV
jgi:hypothetical protein